MKDASIKLAPEDMTWWQDARFGLFIHWGLYAIPAQGEWYMYKGNVPADEYAKYADEFVGKDFDADAWAKAARDADGVIPPSHVAILQEVGDWMARYGQSIYGTRPGPFQPVHGVFGATHKGDRIYIHVLDPVKTPELILPALDRTIDAFSLLSEGELDCEQTASGIKLAISNASDDKFPAVIELVLGAARS